jgi:hypothetical protein
VAIKKVAILGKKTCDGLLFKLLNHACGGFKSKQACDPKRLPVQQHIFQNETHEHLTALFIATFAIQPNRKV